ncbi:MAG: dihydrofolate reductase family protein, partial [Anaerolineaceae bacterium]
MRKLAMFNLITLDGFFEGIHHEIDWHNVDAEFNDHAISQLESTGGLVFGRLTYEVMARYWTSPEARRDDRIIANFMNTIPKYVFSRTLDRVDWENAQLMKGDAAEMVKNLKAQPGKDLLIFGSADLSATLIQHGLIDEFSLLVNPVVLGSGVPLF